MEKRAFPVKSGLSSLALLRVLAPAKVEQLDGEGEAHGAVEVAFRHFDVEGLQSQGRADKSQESESQNLDRGVPVYEIGDGAGEGHHRKSACDNRRYHDAKLSGKADRRYHGVQREDDVQGDNLDYAARKAKARRAFLLDGVLRLSFDFHDLVYLVHRLPKEEKASREKYKVAPGEGMPRHSEDRGGQADQPSYGAEAPS